MKAAAFAPAARDELEAAAEWYESRAEGLGQKLVHCIDEAVARIEESPDRFPQWEGDPRFRTLAMQRFPYVIFYRALPDRIEIVAVAHGAREQDIGSSGSSRANVPDANRLFFHF